MSLERIGKRTVIGQGGGQAEIRWWIIRGRAGIVDIAMIKQDRPYYGSDAERLFPDGWEGLAISCHSRTPREGYEKTSCGMTEDHDTCFFKSSFTAAEQIPHVWRDSGYSDETIWKITEAAYVFAFGEEDAPGQAPGAETTEERD